jgi:uncharacterized Rossmann fold enzyme
MIIMDLIKWMSCYEKILDDFGYQREGDEASAKILENILNKKGALSLDDLQINEKVVVFGAGPSLKENISYLKDIGLDGFSIIAADGATSALLEEKIIPDIIITDLDGDIHCLFIANKKGSIMVVHAHGDNQKKIKKYTPKLDNIMGTTQSRPLNNVYNVGGFTDGDRGVFLAVDLGAKLILLAGMDFGKITTRYSRPNMGVDVGMADEVKQKKLEYAKRLIEWIIKNEDIIILNISKGEKLKGVKDLTPEETSLFLTTFK